MGKNDFEITIKDAAFPKPFKNGLEYNASVHGTWNIVHIGLQMPEAIQIYVCGKNCMRGVVLTAAEMNASHRFSFVIIDEENMISENIDDVTIEGVCDVVEKRKKAGAYPRAIQLFTVCVHHFLGSDYRRIYETLEGRYPDIDFYRCYMDPIMQKKGLTPDQKLRRAMLEKLMECQPRPKTVAILGNDFLLDNDCDIMQLFKANNIEVKQNKACKTYDDFLAMSDAGIFVATYPAAKVGVELAAKRHGRKFLYLPSSFDYEENCQQIIKISEAMGIIPQDVSEKWDNKRFILAQRAKKTYELIGDTNIVIDYTAHPRPLGIAKFLIENGFNVKKVYLDTFNPEEANACEWLKENAPDLLLSATIHVSKRFKSKSSKSSKGEKILAIGQKAAYFEDTPYFINMVAGFGLHGFYGGLRMLDMMEDAFLHEKDTRDIVPRKGLGCESCI